MTDCRKLSLLLVAVFFSNVLSDVVNEKLVRLCPDGESYQKTGMDCGDCSNYKLVLCLPPVDPQPGCYCLPNYHRAYPGGPCIPDKYCPLVCDKRPVCPDGEIYQTQGQDCGNCFNYMLVRCSGPQPIPGCYCLPGYHRAYSGGPCIPTEYCHLVCDKYNQPATKPPITRRPIFDPIGPIEIQPAVDSA